jgi:zinc/manganese transport system substrate-binding protein
MTSRALRRRPVLVAALALAGLGLGACGSSASAHGRIAVVAGEDMWGSIAAQLGGPRVHVTSIVTSPTADPHQYTASAADAAAIHGAALVIVNGAGYDDFMGQLLSASGTSPRVLTVASIAHASAPDPNPHFWYDLATVQAVAAAITSAYVQLDARARPVFEHRLHAFDASLDPIAHVIAAISARYEGQPVAYTERVPGYLLEAAGLQVLTPEGFARSVEAGVEPALSDTVAMEHLLTAHAVRVLLYNVQTVTSVTTQIRQLAASTGIPVVGVSEMLPAADRTYQRWQLTQDTELLRALAR